MSFNFPEFVAFRPLQILMALSACLPLTSCSQADRDSASSTAPAVETEIVTADTSLADAASVPDIVLDGTDVFEFASYQLRPLDESAAGTYRIEQGGAELTLTLSVAGEDWRFERTQQEPGEPMNRVNHTVSLSNGLMMSADSNVMVRGTEEGVLVFERASDTIPADYWVHYISRD